MRRQTGAGMMDCKKALVEAEGDFDVAIDILRKKGQKVAAKRADRDAKEGVAITKINPQVIIHLAAVSHANRSNKDPYSTFDHSLRTLENALDNAKNKIEKIHICRISN